MFRTQHHRRGWLRLYRHLVAFNQTHVAYQPLLHATFIVMPSHVLLLYSAHIPPPLEGSLGHLLVLGSCLSKPLTIWRHLDGNQDLPAPPPSLLLEGLRRRGCQLLSWEDYKLPACLLQHLQACQLEVYLHHMATIH